MPPIAAAIAAAAAVIVLGILLILERHHPTPTQSAEYASHLQLSNLRVSQSEALTGARSTFVDGQVVNTGDRTVNAATVEAVFTFGGGQTQTLTAPLALIHMREPYVDTRPLSAMPLAPGQQADFRLIFEGLNDNWNLRVPTLRVTQASVQ